MPMRIISFGAKYGPPGRGPADTVIDVRVWLHKNPFHNKKLRGLRGDDPAVVADIKKTPHIEAGIAAIDAIGRQCAGILWIGCTGGHHRSVFIANLLGARWGVPVDHRDYHRP